MGLWVSSTSCLGVTEPRPAVRFPASARHVVPKPVFMCAGQTARAGGAFGDDTRVISESAFVLEEPGNPLQNGIITDGPGSFYPELTHRGANKFGPYHFVPIAFT